MGFLQRIVTAVITIACTLLLAGRDAAGQVEFEGWHLEPGVSQAHLVMVARVASISRITVVQGAKTDVALREYRFQPVRRLKGIFQRDQLSMTASDLGCPTDEGSLAPPLKEGEFRLLILAQQQGRFMGCVSAAPGAVTFNERVPLVSGPDDPLVAAIETLIEVADLRSRRERAARLVERLTELDGLASIPLLSSLRLRADWAAADERAFPALVRLAHDPSAVVRGAAVETIRDMLAAQIMPEDPQQLDSVAETIRELLQSDEAMTRLRLTALEAIGHLLALKADVPWARDFLITQVTSAASYAERTAAVTALSYVADPQAATAVRQALASLPLDEAPPRELIYARAAVRLDPEAAEQTLLARLERSIAARQSLEAEIEPLGRMRSKQSLPLLFTAAGQFSLSPSDRHHIAWALGRLGDDRAVPILINWMRGDDYQLKEFALTALETLDSELAAGEARPLLKSEPHLPYKMRLARLLARHGLGDGYALATEHLADVAHTSGATLVLAALTDPRTSNDLSAVIAARPDRRWHAAALSGLMAVGDAAARKQLLEILADDRNALTAGAAEAVGLATENELLVPLATLVRSRNKQIALTSLVALTRFLSGVRESPRGLAAVNAVESDLDDSDSHTAVPDVPVQTRDAIDESVASLVADAYIEPDVRHQALLVARLLHGPHYAALLSDLADQAELEGTQLLIEVQTERRRLNVSLRKT